MQQAGLYREIKAILTAGAAQLQSLVAMDQRQLLWRCP
ncbi:hypothetical protein N234_28450 [Ralstonia pickettii DTP0602]|nr:hypothetical protein N234_28450 [Ralstonia pickettii DTP0602]